MAQEQTKRGGGDDDGDLGPEGGAGQERREKLSEDTCLLYTSPSPRDS